MIEDFFLMLILMVYLKKILAPLSYLMGVETNCFTHLLDTLLSCESGSSCSSGTLEENMYKLRPYDSFEGNTTLNLRPQDGPGWRRRQARIRRILGGCRGPSR